MTINDVYLRYDTPQNLQRHMLDVAGMVQVIKKYWIGSNVDWRIVTSAALLHDLGNIVKFDFDKYPHLLGSEQSHIEYWREVQQSIINKYGSNDHAVTDVMLTELGISEDIRQVISSKSFGSSRQLMNDGTVEAKILLYCDLRVLPSGVGSLSERLNDIKKRLTKYSERPDFDQLAEACYAIQKEIQRSVSVDLSENINNLTLQVHRKNLLQYEI